MQFTVGKINSPSVLMLRGDSAKSLLIPRRVLLLTKTSLRRIPFINAVEISGR